MINLMLIIVVLAVVLKMVDGYKKGMVKEIISFLSLIILCIVGALVAVGVNSCIEGNGKIFNVFVMVLLLSLVGIAHHLLGLVCFPFEMVAELPGISVLNKLLGIVAGACEVILILWTVYTFVMMMDIGPIGQMIRDYTVDSKILSWFYQNNLLAYGIEIMMQKFSFVPLDQLMTLFQ